MEIREGPINFTLMTNRASKSLKLSLCDRREFSDYRTYRCRWKPERAGIGKQLVAKVVEKMRREKRKLSHYAHLRNTNLIKHGSMMYSQLMGEYRVTIFFMLSAVCAGEYLKGRGMHKEWAESAFFVPNHPLYWAKKKEYLLYENIDRG